ncbi:hypothetical protein [Crocinitomix catalasitica]|uniref:hypothetical protein n=1 Tax=Crocinitomix catalasitica TaxID=184607 RepID=UPI00048A37BC|nr:hypothetical protein [Crocinitomix catalasitica]
MKIKPVLPFQDFQLSGSYLVLISPDKIPHLILVQNKKYYSLTYKKSIVGDDFEPFLNVLTKKQYPLIFIELAQKDYIVEREFLKYAHVDTETITCLQPIKNVLLPNSQADFIFEFIPDLAKVNLILNYYQINSTHLLNEDNSFNLKEYSKSDIFKHIESLNLKHVES